MRCMYDHGLKNFTLARYRITLVPEAVIIMPALNKGNVLRGAFGSSLRGIVCSMDRQSGCDACLLKEKCAYALLFTPSGMTGAKRIRNCPRGYVLKPPLSQETNFTSSSPLRFEIVLVGDRVDYFPYVVVPLKELGRVGIGLNRGRFKLGDIEFVDTDGSGHTVYEAETNTVRNAARRRLSLDDIIAKTSALSQEMLTLRFLTPTRIKYNPTGEKGKSRLVRRPEFHHIVRRLRDRISALSAAYCGGPLDMDFKGLAEKALKIETVSSTLRWVEIKRKSRTQGTVHDQSGFVGDITFEGDLAGFLPLILLGEYVHVGEDAVFGNGWYGVRGR